MMTQWFRRPALAVTVVVLCALVGCAGTDPVSSDGSDTGAPTSSDGETAAISLTVNTAQTYQTIRGFGCSGAWWAESWHGVYTEEAIDKVVNYLYHPQTGIGLNTYRYNVGGGTTADVAGDDKYHKYRTYCIETSPGQYDLSADAANIEVLDKIMALGGLTDVTLFMNSPPARMTKTGNTLGNPDGSTNLKATAFGEYAQYVADITKLFVDAGYPITYVSPLNEPQWGWNESKQEGCHYTADEVLMLSRCVLEYLEDTGVPVKLSLPDTANWKDSEYTMGLYMRVLEDDQLRTALDHFSGHSYDPDGDMLKSKNQLLKSLKKLGIDVGDLPFHQTEYAEMKGGNELGIDSALVLSRVIHEDLTVLNVPWWEFWSGAESDNTWHGGLVYLRDEPGRVDPSKRLWALGNYSRFLPGATRVDLQVGDGTADDLFGTAYVDRDGRVIVIVTNESRESRTVSFAGIAGTTAQVYETSLRYSLKQLDDITAAEGYTLPQYSVTTLIFS